MRCRGAAVLLNLGGGNFKTQFRRADRSGARLALILGDEELDRGVVAVKPLRARGRSERLSAGRAARAHRLAAAVDPRERGLVDEYLNEKEQWERLLGSLREQAPWMLAGVAVVLAAFGGWHLLAGAGRAARRSRLRHVYQQALAAFTRNDLAGGIKIADRRGAGISAARAYGDQAESGGGARAGREPAAGSGGGAPDAGTAQHA